MAMTLETGRPADETGRLEKELRCYDFLDALGVAYQRVDHPPAMTMEVCGEIDRTLRAMICKNLFLCNRRQTAFYLLLLPGDKRFLTKELSGQLGVARLSFADAGHMEELLDITPGSVSVLGLMNDREKRVQLVIDGDVWNASDFACHPCINTSSLRFSMADFREKILPALGHPPIHVSLAGE